MARIFCCLRYCPGVYMAGGRKGGKEGRREEGTSTNISDRIEMGTFRK
jgi:hypothetical protein